MDIQRRRETIRRLLDVAVAAVEPESLTRRALSGEDADEVTLIAIGKGSPAMARGADVALSGVAGICVAPGPDQVPENVELIVGDHPVPGTRSFAAGRRAIEVAGSAKGRIVALISGGGSALCEHPIDGVPAEFIMTVNEILLAAGASIDEMNLVRRHLSAIKGGGLARAATGPIDTYAISDVCGADPSVIASGPTIPQVGEPDAAISAMERHGIEVPVTVREAIRKRPNPTPPDGSLTVLADGHTAADALVEQAQAEQIGALAMDGWLHGPVEVALERFLTNAGPGLTVASGEPDVVVGGDGRGGRNTHAALLAARLLAGTDSVFAAFATDGVDGNSFSAGAIVDGATIERGGDPSAALTRSDSAGYLAAGGDLIVTGPTGTNVSDLWILWR